MSLQYECDRCHLLFHDPFGTYTRCVPCARRECRDLEQEIVSRLYMLEGGDLLAVLNVVRGLLRERPEQVIA